MSGVHGRRAVTSSDPEGARSGRPQRSARRSRRRSWSARPVVGHGQAPDGAVEAGERRGPRGSVAAQPTADLEVDTRRAGDRPVRRDHPRVVAHELQVGRREPHGRPGQRREHRVERDEQLRRPERGCAGDHHLGGTAEQATPRGDRRGGAVRHVDGLDEVGTAGRVCVREAGPLPRVRAVVPGHGGRPVGDQPARRPGRGGRAPSPRRRRS